MKTEKPQIALTYKKNGGVDQWHMDVDGKGEKGPGQYDKLVVGQGDDGIFTFEIKTNKIAFDPAKPIEIKKQSTGTDPGLPGQFITTIIDGKLIVADPNSDKVPTDYYYKLNFIGENGPINPLDPVISNGCCKTGFVSDGGGGTQLMSWTGMAVVLFAAALLAILGNVVWRWLR